MNQYNPNASLLLSIAQKRILLAQFLCSNWKVKKHLKINGEIVEVNDDINPALILRAIAMDMKLEKEQQKLEQQEAALAQHPAEAPVEDAPAATTAAIPATETEFVAAEEIKTATPQKPAPINRKQRRALEKQLKAKPTQKV